MDKLQNLINELKTILNKRLCSVIIYGSNANLENEKLNSNTDLMIVISKFNSQDLKKIKPLIQKWIDIGNPHPIVIGKEEIDSMLDIYTLEFVDIKWNYQLVYGEDVIQNINVNYNELKNQIIRELTYLLMKFRACYLEYGNNKRVMKKVFLELISSCLVIFRGILNFQNISPSVYKNDLIDQISEITRIDKILFKRLLSFKEKKENLPSYMYDDGVMLVINQLLTLLQQIRIM